MNDRLLPGRNRRRFAAAGAGLVAVLFAALLGGCANPNFIGVQDYGTIIGNVVDGNGKPINGALVTATGTSNTIRTNTDGSFSLPQVAIGTQTLSVSAAGYSAPASAVTVVVAKDTSVSAGNVALASTTSIPR